jgi:RNA-directed DNA polymerase
VTQLHQMIRKISANGTRPCYALKMDIRRFFDTIDHQILKALLRKNIKDTNILKTTDMIIDSFKIKGAARDVGIPLGNVTSQIFANLYLHELDDFVKQELKERFYLRYSDDFILLSNNKPHLDELIVSIRKFLAETLQLELHPKKVTIKKLSQGIDFVGYVLFDRYVLSRTRTKQRMKRRLREAYEHFYIGKITAQSLDQRLQSYLGLLSHANQYELSTALKNAYWVRSETGRIPTS